MFDIFPHLLSSIASFLFPLFASYKALKGSDPRQLRPWLMYWVVMSITILFESWTEWILAWIPLYAYFRLFFHLYLILPQTQGAKHLYITYVEPWIDNNEGDIDMLIASAHERLRAAGMTYLKLAIEWFRVTILHLPPDETLNQQSAEPSAYQSGRSYTANLLSRFAQPPGGSSKSTAQGGWGAVGGDFYSVLASAVTSATSMAGSAATASSRSGPSSSEGVSSSGSRSMIPENLRSAHPDDQLSFLNAQRERLSILMGALDRDAASLQVPGAFHSEPSLATPTSTTGSTSSRPASGMSRNRSEADFEKIDHLAFEESEDSEGPVRRRGGDRGNRQSGSWMPWAGSSGEGGARSSGHKHSE